MDQPTQNQETIHVKVAGPYYDRTMNRWRLRLMTSDGIELVAELDRTGRALNEHFGRNAIVKGILSSGPKGERIITLARFDVPGSRAPVSKEEAPPDDIIDDELEWDAGEDDEIADDDSSEEEPD